jgi:hypothetical protein
MVPRLSRQTALRDISNLRGAPRASVAVLAFYIGFILTHLQRLP